MTPPVLTENTPERTAIIGDKYYFIFKSEYEANNAYHELRRKFTNPCRICCYNGFSNAIEVSLYD